MDPELARDVDDTIAELRSYGHHPTADLLQRLWNHINTPAHPPRLYRVFFHHARGPISGCASIDYEGPITPDRIDQITQDAATEIGIPAHALVITGWAPYDQPQEQR